jgi:hypothetical protein
VETMAIMKDIKMSVFSIIDEPYNIKMPLEKSIKI